MVSDRFPGGAIPLRVEFDQPSFLLTRMEAYWTSTWNLLEPTGVGKKLVTPKIWFGYESIPINTIFRGMNIHLPAIFMFTRGTRFWHTAIYECWWWLWWYCPENIWEWCKRYKLIGYKHLRCPGHGSYHLRTKTQCSFQWLHRLVWKNRLASPQSVTPGCFSWLMRQRYPRYPDIILIYFVVKYWLKDLAGFLRCQPADGDGFQGLRQCVTTNSRGNPGPSGPGLVASELGDWTTGRQLTLKHGTVLVQVSSKKRNR